MSIDSVAAHPELAAEWVADKVQREAAFMLGRGFSAQLEMLTGRGLVQFSVPKWVCVRRLSRHEVRLRLPSGEWVIVDEETGAQTIQLPIGATKYKFHMLQNVTDRGPINTALLHFLMHEQYLISCHWGPFHGMWNSVKNSLRNSCQGRPWQAVLGFILLANMNYFPFKSSQGYRDKQDALKKFLASNDSNCAPFQSIKTRFARANKMPCRSEDDEQQLFAKLASMASFRAK